MSRPIDPVEPSKFQTENKDRAKEPFNRAAEGREQMAQEGRSEQQTGKVSETVRRDRPHMAPRPEGNLRTVETRTAYDGVAKEHAQFKKGHDAQSRKLEAAVKIAKNLQKQEGMENNRDNGRSDDRGR